MQYWNLTLRIPRPRRQWFQFRLRTLLLLTAVLCLAVFPPLQRALQQKRAVEAVRAAGGDVLYDFQVGVSGKWNRDAQPPGPSWLWGLLGWDLCFDVVGVLPAAQTSDAYLQQLKALPELRYAYLGDGYTALTTDEGLAHLEALQKLEILHVGGYRVTDAGMVHLAKIPTLKEIHLTGAAITKAGVAELQQTLPTVTVYHGLPD